VLGSWHRSNAYAFTSVAEQLYSITSERWLNTLRGPLLFMATAVLLIALITGIALRSARARDAAQRELLQNEYADETDPSRRAMLERFMRSVNVTPPTGTAERAAATPATGGASVTQNNDIKIIGSEQKAALQDAREFLGRVGAELVERRGVVPSPLRLPVGPVGATQVGPLVPVEPEPAQLVQDPRLHAGAHPRAVQVLHAHQPGAAAGAGVQPGEQRRPGVAEVERTGRTWGEAAAGGHPP
jgi:hypothetical protein